MNEVTFCWVNFLDYPNWEDALSMFTIRVEDYLNDGYELIGQPDVKENPGYVLAFFRRHIHDEEE